MERETGLEPVTSSLGSWHSTTELLPLNWNLKYSKSKRLRASPKSASVRIPDSTVSRTWHSIKNDLRHADELAQNENGQYATSAAAYPETAYRTAPRIADVHAAVFDFQLQIIASLTPISRISPGPCARLRTASTSPMICS